MVLTLEPLELRSLQSHPEDLLVLGILVVPQILVPLK
jgi:hypothetical protein